MVRLHRGSAGSFLITVGAGRKFATRRVTRLSPLKLLPKLMICRSYIRYQVRNIDFHQRQCQDHTKVRIILGLVNLLMTFACYRT